LDKRKERNHPYLFIKQIELYLICWLEERSNPVERKRNAFSTNYKPIYLANAKFSWGTFTKILLCFGLRTLRYQHKTNNIDVGCCFSKLSWVKSQRKVFLQKAIRGFFTLKLTFVNHFDKEKICMTKWGNTTSILS